MKTKLHSLNSKNEPLANELLNLLRKISIKPQTLRSLSSHERSFAALLRKWGLVILTGEAEGRLYSITELGREILIGKRPMPRQIPPTQQSKARQENKL